MNLKRLEKYGVSSLIFSYLWKFTENNLECISATPNRLIQQHITHHQTQKTIYTYAKQKFKGLRIVVIWYGIALSRALNVESAEITIQHTQKRKIYERNDTQRYSQHSEDVWKCQWNWTAFGGLHARNTKTKTHGIFFFTHPTNSIELHRTCGQHLKFPFNVCLCIDIKLFLSLCNLSLCQKKIYQFLSTSLQLIFHEQKNSNTVKALVKLQQLKKKLLTRKWTFYNSWFD